MYLIVRGVKYFLLQKFKHSHAHRAISLSLWLRCQYILFNEKLQWVQMRFVSLPALLVEFGHNAWTNMYNNYIFNVCSLQVDSMFSELLPEISANT
jgi:hypothetical protein